jgi:hypothetical protein
MLRASEGKPSPELETKAVEEKLTEDNQWDEERRRAKIAWAMWRLIRGGKALGEIKGEERQQRAWEKP